jgi:excisionase family DNA binding protein
MDLLLSAIREWPNSAGQEATGGKAHSAVVESAGSKRLITLQELVDHLRVTHSTLHRVLARNQIPAFRVGRHWRFDLDEIDNWCASRALTNEG